MNDNYLFIKIYLYKAFCVNITVNHEITPQISFCGYIVKNRGVTDGIRAIVIENDK